jgi:hypothetical protein
MKQYNQKTVYLLANPVSPGHYNPRDNAELLYQPQYHQDRNKNEAHNSSIKLRRNGKKT